ncbi:hypothetical protein [Aestuariicoccus sp. MJ-SS9]|uniref:hypothetical protein n=1 Tax=Aestuariicoccus sp. MJ-SS9 TaxID=3079855 RepID=UPI00290ACF3D|nr:hypothetical protein [Aestuariicoccus sp. MJ-SS9]MDU8913357.1 hypothetical protein [Aestuariicoccus sp. MJ-SS9]
MPAQDLDALFPLRPRRRTLLDRLRSVLRQKRHARDTLRRRDRLSRQPHLQRDIGYPPEPGISGPHRMDRRPKC